LASLGICDARILSFVASCTSRSASLKSASASPSSLAMSVGFLKYYRAVVP